MAKSMIAQTVSHMGLKSFQYHSTFLSV